jgi:glycerophosphoryl diester phosphodiesterase
MASPFPPTVERIGHRGAPREFPENTLPAFLRALERGAAAVELDVHATVDGVVVVHHDATIAKASDPAQIGGKLTEMTWADVQRVELAPNVFVPSLPQVLSAIAERAVVYVEIKGADIEALVIETIRRSPSRCAVHSFDHALIRHCAQLAPEIPRGILFEDRPVDVGASMDAASARDVWLHWKLVDKALVQAVHARGGRVVVWTVNTPDVASSMRALGADGICTDDLRVVDAALSDPRAGG